MGEVIRDKSQTTDPVPLDPACVIVPRVTLERLVYAAADAAGYLMESGYQGKSQSLMIRAVELGDMIGMKRRSESDV